VWGHDHAVTELQSAIRRGPRHAYILSGYHDVGKEALALEFARALNCTASARPGVPCHDCATCRRIGRGTHPDVTRYDLARQQDEASKSSTSKHLSLTIETVRRITSDIALRPLEGRHRVVIVDDVETMQETAQEAFLKTLEEPPPYAVILLLTTDAEILLETIRSRASTIQLQTVRAETVAAMLEQSGVRGDDANRIAAASVGRPGWAIRAANDPALLSGRLELRKNVVSWIASDQYERITEATRLGDGFGKDRGAVYARLSVAQTIWRAAVLDAVGQREPGHEDLAFLGSRSISAADAILALRSVDRCIRDLDANVRPRLALQSMVLQWPTPRT
jgi:DNA polymerase-3 subunit delta'